MQTRNQTRARQAQSPNIKSPYPDSKYRKEDNRVTLIVLGLLCGLLPPLGVLLTWRAQRIELPIRGILTGVALVSCTLIFTLLMRPGVAATDIRPTPVQPQTIGYNAAPTAAAATQVPAPPDMAVPAVPGATDASVLQEPGELTDDTIVYAVTNNASSYHLYEICDQQENRRALTLREALNEGLAPCEKCVGARG